MRAEGQRIEGRRPENPAGRTTTAPKHPPEPQVSKAQVAFPAFLPEHQPCNGRHRQPADMMVVALHRSGSLARSSGRKVHRRSFNLGAWRVPAIVQLSCRDGRTSEPGRLPRRRQTRPPGRASQGIPKSASCTRQARRRIAQQQGSKHPATTKSAVGRADGQGQRSSLPSQHARLHDAPGNIRAATLGTCQPCPPPLFAPRLPVV